jgi:hypothetical protein
MTTSAARPPAGSSSTAKPVQGWAAFGLIVGMIWLAGQILTQGMADHYAPQKPAAAVLWRGDSADALASLAQQRLIARDPDHAALFARKALQRWPLDVAALSTLGVAMDQAGRSQPADAVMTLAGQLSWRDGLAQAWLFGHRAIQGRYDEAMQRADALLRRPISFRPQLYASLAGAIHDPRAIEPLARRLELEPSWRTEFVAGLGPNAKPEDEPAVHALLVALAKGRAPPTNEELGLYLQRTITAQDWPRAVAALRELSHATPAAGEYLYDGDFDRGPGVAPFDWTILQSVGASTLVAGDPAETHGKALRVEYDGFASSEFAKQLLVMPPGDYVLSGKIRQETQEAPRQLSWSVQCASDNRVLAKASGDGARQGQWVEFRTPITVPATGCPGQWLQLSADAGDRHSEIVVWYDDLSVRRR